MTKTSKKIIFFGTEDFSLATLRALIDAGYSISAVVTKLDSKRGRGHKLTEPSVKRLAQAHNIPVWQPTKLREIENSIRALQPVIGILVSFGKIIPQSTLDLFDPGIINLHPSLLPKYRGPSPVESAIANGDIKTGVSIMRLSAAMDAGPIYRQAEITLNGSETRPMLYDKLSELGTAELLAALPEILDGSLIPTEQNESGASYCELLSKDTALLDPHAVDAATAERLVRAHLGFPRTKYVLQERTVIITRAHIDTQQNTSLDIRCRDGAYLIIDEVIAPSGKTMTAASFLNGYAAGV